MVWFLGIWLSTALVATSMAIAATVGAQSERVGRTSAQLASVGVLPGIPMMGYGVCRWISPFGHSCASTGIQEVVVMICAFGGLLIGPLAFAASFLRLGLRTAPRHVNTLRTCAMIAWTISAYFTVVEVVFV